MFQLLRGLVLPAAACDGSRDGDSRYANLFRKLDLNEDGRVDIAELQTGLRAMGIPLGKEAEEVRAGRGRGGPSPRRRCLPEERPPPGTPQPWGGRGAARPPHPAARPGRDGALPAWLRRGGPGDEAARPGLLRTREPQPGALGRPGCSRPRAFLLPKRGLQGLRSAGLSVLSGRSRVPALLAVWLSVVLLPAGHGGFIHRVSALDFL